MHLTFSEIAGARVGLTADEAAALVLAAAREFDMSAASATAAALPPPGQILLTSTGRVSFLTAVVKAGGNTGRDRVADAGLLLRALLGLDADAVAANRTQAPGALLLLIARAAGEIDLPPLSYEAFLSTLARFGSPEASTLAAIYKRCVTQLVDTSNISAQPALSSTADSLPRERRRNGPRPSALRRELRATELELFVARTRSARRLQSSSVLSLTSRNDIDTRIANTRAAEAGAAAVPSRERRRRGPRASDLRRELRTADLELFAARARAARQNRRRAGVTPRLASAAAIAASVLLGAAWWAAPALRHSTGLPPGIQAADVAVQDHDEAPLDVTRPLVTVRAIPAYASPAERSPSPREGSPRREDSSSHSDGRLSPANDSSSGAATIAVPPPNGPHTAAAISARPLISAALVGADIFSPSFAEHGHEVLFHAGRDRAALMRASFDGSGRAEVATLLKDGAANHHATLSADGTRLAYDSDRDGTRAVYVARADASSPEKVSGDGYAAVPRWSPDGRRLAFIRAELKRPSVWNVWVADLDAHTLSRVSHHRVGQAWGGSWFPDGRLAYSVEDTLVIADLSNGTTRVLRSPLRGRLVRTPAVSPDGRWIVFQVYRDGVWLLDVGAMTMRRVLADAAAEEFAWSPDSERVAYHTRRQHAWSLWQLALPRAAATA
jgi:Tol biopolymer transport system component